MAASITTGRTTQGLELTAVKTMAVQRQKNWKNGREKCIRFGSEHFTE